MEQPRRTTGKELHELNRRTHLSFTVIDAIRDFPVARIVEHCGTSFDVFPFDIYRICQTCGLKIKLRGLSGVSEIEDVFDAVFQWLLVPDALAVCGHDSLVQPVVLWVQP